MPVSLWLKEIGQDGVLLLLANVPQLSHRRFFNVRKLAKWLVVEHALRHRNGTCLFLGSQLHLDARIATLRDAIVTRRSLEEILLRLPLLVDKTWWAELSLSKLYSIHP